MNLPAPFLDLPLAHRGLHNAAKGVLENTLTACRHAAQAGYGIEIDVQLSADGQAMVFHDATLDRLTEERGPIRERSAPELSHITVGGSADVILPLATVLDAIPATTPVLIEMKDQSGSFSDDASVLPGAVADALKARQGLFAAMSFNPFYTRAFCAAAPEVPAGLVTEDFGAKKHLPASQRDALTSIEAFDSAGACFISHDSKSLDLPAVTRLKSDGVPVLCWTVRSPAEEAAARDIADNITFEGYLPVPSVANA